MDTIMPGKTDTVRLFQLTVSFLVAQVNIGRGRCKIGRYIIVH